MTRVQTNGLQVAPVLHDFIEREAIAGTGYRALPSGAVWPGSCGTSRRATGSCSPSATRSRPRSTSITAAGPGRPLDQAEYERSCARSAISCPSRRIFRSTRRTWTTRSPASPVRSSSCRSPTPATRSTPPMPAGAASTTRSTAPMRSRGRTAPARGAATTRRAAPRVVARARGVLDAGRAARRRQPCAMPSATRVEGGALVVDLEDGSEHRPRRTRRSSSAISGDAATPVRACCCATTACIIEIVIDRTHPIGSDDPAGIADVVLEARRLHHHGLRGLASRRSMPRTRSWSIATGSA